MDRIWAPWRIEYILEPDKTDECIFCRALNSPDDAADHVLWRSESCFAMMNKYPYNNGHIMVVPNKHTGVLESLSVRVLGEMMGLVCECKKLLSAVMNPDGFNVGINLGKVAGAGIEQHVHIHIVPRWNGDTNFMPVLADTRVIPQALNDTYSALLEKKSEIIG